MKANDKPFQSIDEYIAACPNDVRERLARIRSIVRRIAPDAQERISYRMPAFHLNGNLVYFAAFRNHIGFFPTSSGVREFEHELSPYKHAKGSIQFPLSEPLPVGLIGKIVKYRVAENRKKAVGKLERHRKTRP